MLLFVELLSDVDVTSICNMFKFRIRIIIEKKNMLYVICKNIDIGYEPAAVYS